MLPDSAASCSVFDADNALEKNRDAISSCISGVAERFEQTTLQHEEEEDCRKESGCGLDWTLLDLAGKGQHT